MADTGKDGPNRLDSWKAIAKYLGRDVRTVRRWEGTQGLPVRRVPGGGGRSVYAYASEIDAWLQSHPPASSPDNGSADRQSGASPTVAADRPTSGRSRWAWRAASLGLAGVLIATSVAWRLLARASDAELLTVQVTLNAIVARDSVGTERWRHAFPAGEQASPPGSHEAPVILGSPRAGVIVATSDRIHNADDGVLSGQVFSLTSAGRLERTWTPADRLTFGAREFGAPWVISDFRVDERSGVRRVAVAVRHFQWWPGIVSVLDERFTRLGTFVNPGWIEGVHWLSADRLVATGFSNARDGGMVALLDARALDGQAPATGDETFRCATCGAGAPIRYVILPRSEVNRATASPFNRARLQPEPDRLVVRTIELPDPVAGAADIVYEFSPSLDLMRASFSDRYWEVHRSLEMQGKIAHTREQCPDRDGPRAIEMWEPQTGWRTLSTTR